MPYFNTIQEPLMQRVQFLVAMVGESQLTGEPCPLLDKQLNRLAVLIDELESAVRDVREALKD